MDPGASPSKEELLALLQQERERSQKERQRAERERQRAEQAEERTRKTTFAEYLQACHSCISRPLSIQTNRSLTTKGSITSPTGRICPTYLRPFDFRSEQQSLFDEIYRFFHSPSASPLRTFPPLLVINDRGQRACDRPLASEADLVRHQEAEVETPVKEVIDNLAQLPEARNRFPLAEGIMFENHTNTITEEPGLIQAVDKQPIKADQNCVYLRSGSDRRLLYVIEYKAGHKLPDAFLRAGLRPMNVLEEVVQRVTIPVDPEEKLLYDSTFLSCAAVTQAFEYMIKGGLEYSCLTNGRMKVILRVLEDDPATLYYCLLEPSRDAEADMDDGHGFRLPYTAVACQLGLTMIALQSDQRSQLWCNRAIQQLNKWEVDFEEAVRSIPLSERKKSPPDSDYRAPRYPINPRSPYLLRRRLVSESFDSTLPSRRDSSPDPSSESDLGQAHLPSSPIERQRKRQRSSNQTSRSSRTSGPGRQPNRQYCTQTCLRGLSVKSELDLKCPNVALHQKHSNDGRHPLSRLRLVELTSRQLNSDPDHCCRPLWKEGIHGSLFAITLDTYGYTFVGKGTEYSSHYEGDVYQKLQALQGSAVPVYLGDIYLRKNVYYLDSGRVIIHMSLMAWGGDTIWDANYSSLKPQIERTKAEVLEAGVEHLDLRTANMLWNEEMKRVMLIDFGRARIHQSRKHAMQPDILSNSKRTKQCNTRREVMI